MGRRAVVVGVAVAVLGLAACGDGEDRPGQVTSDSGSASGSVSGSGTGSASGTGDEKPAFEESAADTVIDVTLDDYRFEGLPATAKGPKLYFEVKNSGKHPHELEILDADGDAIDELHEMAPGDEGVLAVELQPGTYTVQCLVEEKGKPHSDLGMKTTLKVE